MVNFERRGKITHCEIVAPRTGTRVRVPMETDALDRGLREYLAKLPEELLEKLLPQSAVLDTLRARRWAGRGSG